MYDTSLLAGTLVIHLSHCWGPWSGMTAVWTQVCQLNLRSVGLGKSQRSSSSSDRQSSVSSAVSWIMSSHDRWKWYHPTCPDWKTVFVLWPWKQKSTKQSRPKHSTFSCSRRFHHITDKVFLVIVGQLFWNHIKEKTLNDPNLNVECGALLSSHELLLWEPNLFQSENWMFAVWERIEEIKNRWGWEWDAVGGI